MKRIFLDMDGTIAKFNVRNALDRFATEKGFFSKLGAYKNIEIINELCKNGNIYIISASPNFQADKDKLTWISKYLPNLDIENVCFCRLGENKAKIIEEVFGFQIDKNCFLLDDYTKNLTEWETVGGVGIKRLTTVSDNSRGLWTGLTLKDLKELSKIA